MPAKPSDLSFVYCSSRNRRTVPVALALSGEFSDEMPIANDMASREWRCRLFCERMHAQVRVDSGNLLLLSMTHRCQADDLMEWDAFCARFSFVGSGARNDGAHTSKEVAELKNNPCKQVCSKRNDRRRLFRESGSDDGSAGHAAIYACHKALECDLPSQLPKFKNVSRNLLDDYRDLTL
ncbi:hypothetical protein Aduo_001992 [Ancylostoma duodenale]